MKTLWRSSAWCKAVGLAWNAWSNTGTYTGIKSHSRTDSDTGRRLLSGVKLLGWAAPAPLPLGRQLHRSFLLAVCTVGADLHQGPSEAGPFVVVGNSQLSNIIDPYAAF